MTNFPSLNLTGRKLKDTYTSLVVNSGSVITTGEGNLIADLNNISGSLFGTASWAIGVTNVLSVTSSITSSTFLSGSATGSFFGTSSWANKSVTSSFAVASTSDNTKVSKTGDNVSGIIDFQTGGGIRFENSSQGIKFGGATANDVTVQLSDNYIVSVTNPSGSVYFSGSNVSASNFIGTASWATNLIGSNNFLTAISGSDIGRPEDFGAIGDGITDDWKAIKNCILSHSIIEFDAKTYAVRGFLPVPSNTIIRGKGIDKTVIKIMDNSPYGYLTAGVVTGNIIFFSVITPDDVFWYPSTIDGHAPVGTIVGSGSAEIVVNVPTSSGVVGRWCIGKNRPFEELTSVDIQSNLTARINVTIENMTLDANFNNQAKHSTLNWAGNPQSGSNGGFAYYSPKYDYKVKNNIGLIGLTGQNILVKNIKCKGWGSGVPYVDSAGNPPNFEEFICVLLNAGNITDLRNYETSFTETLNVLFPISKQQLVKPNRIIGCIAESPGDPDLQSQDSTQTIFGSSNPIDIFPMQHYPNYSVNARNDYELYSSVEDCSIFGLYDRMPSTASIWSGSILSGYVTSSITSDNLSGSFDGAIPGNGWKTGSIGNFAIVPGSNGYAVYKKIKDGSSYGRWEHKPLYWEHYTQAIGSSIARNNRISAIDVGFYTDSWRSAVYIENNFFVDCLYGINLNIYGEGQLAADYLYAVIKNNYIQVIDRVSGMSTDGGTLFGIFLNVIGSSSNADLRGMKDVIIQDNIIKTPVSSSRFQQQYFQNLNGTTTSTGSGELQNFSGSLSGSITGTVGYFVSSSGASSNLFYNGTFTNIQFVNFSGSISGAINGTSNLYVMSDQSGQYNSSFSGAFNGTVDGFTGIISGAVSSNYYQGYFAGSVVGFTGYIGGNTSYTGNAYFDRLYSVRQTQLAFPTNTSFNFQTTNFSDQNLVNGILLPLDNNFKVKNVTIQGNSFLNFTPEKYKGHTYTSVTENALYIGEYSRPLVFISPYSYYKNTDINVIGTENDVKKISTFNIENNFDDNGNLVPLLINNPTLDQLYVIQNCNKDSLFIEKNSILTPEVNNSIGVTSNPHFLENSNASIDWTLTSGSSSSTSFFGQFLTNPSYGISMNVFQTGSISQVSTSFVNQVLPNTKYVIDYSLSTPFSPAPDSASFSLGSYPIYNWTNSLDNTFGNHRIFFTTPANPTGSFTLTFTKNPSTSVIFKKINLYKYNNTSSITWKVKNHIINLDDDVKIIFIDTGSYITASANTHFVLGKDLIPNNEEIDITLRQHSGSVYSVTWPNYINWKNGIQPNSLATGSLNVYKIRYSLGNYYGNIQEYQLPNVFAAKNIGVNQISPIISDGNGIHVGGKILRLDTSKTPSTSSAAGLTGEICWDSNFLYVCVASASWKRTTLSSW